MVMNCFKMIPVVVAVTMAIASPAGLACAAPEKSVSEEKMLLPEAEIVIDAGHGGIDGGASHGDLLEKDINLQIAQKLYEELSRLGHTPALTRTGDYALSDDNRWHKHPSRHLRDLSQRKELSNQLQPKLLVSLHANVSRSSGKSGPLLLYQSKKEPSRQLALLIQQELNAVYHADAVPFPGKTFYLLKKSDCPAVIVEMGYLTNANDRNRLTDEKGQKEIAAAIAAAIHRYREFSQTN